MNYLVNSKVPTKEQINRLQSEVATMPQAGCDTDHFFRPGMYCRKVFAKAGTLIVGKEHKEPHFFICAGGEMIAWSETGMREMFPGDIIESGVGTKRVILCVTDAVMITIHKTDKTDLKEIENELIVPDEQSLFDEDNKLKTELISSDALKAHLITSNIIRGAE